ncbi:GNAT family N-acetyltransferase [Acinetobacter sp. XS-4]|uniref:GNAT family N-acetyltransferase n=1 Tax=Acinetobacter sp. XS-4 TaxID=2923375 RepID=UPI00208F575D|nr:GNAT family N-acetyltransferase [Acinetobacter sp. XS-4]USP40726.1 GNAT family N-acetyltransferase [Acinetobacter sp. XS-4]
MSLSKVSPSLIETSRLYLRKFIKGDEISLFYEYCGDVESAKYLQRKAHSDIDQTRKMLEVWGGEKWHNQDHNFAWIISERQENLAIGLIIFSFNEHRGEVHFGIGRKFQKQGLMLEALNSLIGYLKENSTLNMLETFCDVENVRAQNVLIKCGFIKSKILKDWAKFPLLDDHPRDCIQYVFNINN